LIQRRQVSPGATLRRKRLCSAGTREMRFGGWTYSPGAKLGR
jgi:hypothetical protein